MDDAKREALWEAYFNADYRHRYFLALKSRLAARTKWLGIAIAVLSCGPLVGLLWQIGAGEWLAALGVVAGVLGIYVGSSSLPRSIAVAIQAATAWGQATSRLAHLWARCESGEDVWDEYVALDRDLSAIDAVATEHLGTNEKLIDAAWQKTMAALAPS